MAEEQRQKEKHNNQKHGSFSSGAFGFNFIRGQEPATIKYTLRSFYCSNWLINISVFPLLYLRRVHFCKQEFFSNETYSQ